MQTALPVVLALTFPGTFVAGGRTDSGFGGTMQEKNRYSVLIPLGTMFLTGLVNLIYFGPATTSVMRERKHQGKIQYHLLESALLNEQQKQGTEKKLMMLHLIQKKCSVLIRSLVHSMELLLLLILWDYWRLCGTVVL